MQRPSFLKWSLIPKLALALVSMVLTIFLAEVAFRLITGEKVRLQGMWTANEAMGLQLAPGFEGSMSSSEFQYDVVINEHGMRDDPLDLDLLSSDHPDLSRLLILGDSFAFGNGVSLEDSLPKALERRLNAESEEKTYKTFNGGMPGTSTFHHMHNLRRLAPVVRPDQVLLFFFTGDDWYGNNPRQPPGTTKMTLKNRLRTLSSFYRYLDRFLLSRSRGAGMYKIHYSKADPDHLKRMDHVLGMIDQMGEITAEHGAKILICIIPRYVQVYDDAWKKGAFVYGLEPGLYDTAEPNRRFAEKLSQRGFKTLDLLPDLQSEGKKRLLHFPIDGHWNVPGNTFVAEIVARRVLSEAAVVETPEEQEGAQEG